MTPAGTSNELDVQDEWEETHTHTVSLIPPREDQCEWHRMTRMTGPDCVVMCNLINTHTHTLINHVYQLTRTLAFLARAETVESTSNTVEDGGRERL